jgi:hypothetical protein
MSPIRYGLSLLVVLVLGFKLGQLVFDKNHSFSEGAKNTELVPVHTQLLQANEYNEDNECQHSFVVRESGESHDSISTNNQKNAINFLQDALRSTSNENTLRILDELAIIEDSVLFDKSIDYLQSQNASEQEVALTLLAKAIDNNNQSAIQSTMASAHNLLSIDADSEEEAAKLMGLFTQAAIVSSDDVHKQQSHSLLLRHSYSDSLYIKMQAAKGLIALAPENPATQHRMYELLTESLSVEEKIAVLNVLSNSSLVNEQTLAYVSQLAESPHEPISVRTRSMALLNNQSHGSLSVQSY